MIKPTVGRKVWFWPMGVKSSGNKLLQSFDDKQPMDATVLCAWGDRCVNLLVVDHAGETHALRSVTLRQADDPNPGGYFCEWMPYQVGQAARATP